MPGTPPSFVADKRRRTVSIRSVRPLLSEAGGLALCALVAVAMGALFSGYGW